MAKKSKADLLRNHIREQLNKNYDYSLASNRKADIQIFIEQNKNELEKTDTAKTLRPSHSKILDEQLKNKGIDPSSLGRSSKKPKFNSDLNPVITPEPQAGVTDSTKPTGAPIQGQAGVTGAPQQVSPTGELIVPAFDEKAVSATFQSFLLMLKLNYPDLELLTDEEKDSLGKIWLPFFNKYLSDKYSEILIPVFATAGIFLPKIAKARAIKKGKSEVLEVETQTIDPKLQAEADRIKKEALEKEKQQKDSSSQEQQKIQQAIDENEALPKIPKLGEVDTEIHVPK